VILAARGNDIIALATLQYVSVELRAVVLRAEVLLRYSVIISRVE